MAVKIIIDGPSNTSQDVIYNVALDSSSSVNQILEICEGHIQSTNNMFKGDGVPSDSMGNDGNIYTDETTKDVYIKKNGKWEKVDVPEPGPGPQPTPTSDSYVSILAKILPQNITGIVE